MKNNLSFLEMISSEGKTTFILGVEDMEVMINEEEALWFKEKLEKALSEDEYYKDQLSEDEYYKDQTY